MLYFLQELLVQDNLFLFFGNIKKPSKDKMDIFIDLVLSLLKISSM